jgi:hypothetical protein
LERRSFYAHLETSQRSSCASSLSYDHSCVIVLCSMHCEQPVKYHCRCSSSEVFGTSLEALCERDEMTVPRFIQECLLAVEYRGECCNGLAYAVLLSVTSTVIRN